MVQQIKQFYNSLRFLHLDLVAMLRLMVIFILTSSAVLASTNTLACNIKDIPLGKTLNEVSVHYQLPVDEKPNASQLERIEILARGSDFCDKLPGNSRAKFEFISNILVRMTIVIPNSHNTLLELTTTQLGSTHTTPNSGRPDNGDFSNVWKNDVMAVTYSLRGHLTSPTSSDIIEQLTETISISSTKHSRLMQQAYEQEENPVIDDNEGEAL